jgi:uncharacterized protein YbcI
MVAILKQYIGRGPVRSRAFLADDTVTVVLEETLTEVELTLARAGKDDVVKEMRQSYQDALCKDAKALVEEAVSAEVTAVMFDQSVDPDVSVLVFLLAPSANGA